MLYKDSAARRTRIPREPSSWQLGRVCNSGEQREPDSCLLRESLGPLGWAPGLVWERAQEQWAGWGLSFFNAI